MVTRTNKYLPLLMWSLPVFFFAYQFILRLWPSLMMHQIMHQFAIDASAYGMLAALYYYGYSSMQIPIAMLLDRYSVRYILSASAILCGLSVYVFTHTDSWMLACISRFFVGVGSAVGFLGVSKTISEWFPKSQYTKMIGFSFTVGLLGAIYGGKPVNYLVENYDWQKVAFTLGCISIAIGLAAYLFLRGSKKSENAEEGFKFANFKKLLSSPSIWLLAFGNFLMVGSLEGFADVWGVPYLMTAYQFQKGTAAELVSFIFIGMLAGGPLLAALSKRLGNYTVISLCGFGMALAFIFLFSKLFGDWYSLAGLFFLVGIMCCYQVIVFAAGANLVETSLLGVTVAFLNSINMFGGSFFHSIIGVLMDTFWTGTIDSEGIRVYEESVFESALLIIPACSIVGSLIVSFVRFRLKQNATVHA